MKKKLLITMGDSFTEGVGCYPDHILEKYGMQNYNSYKKPQNHPEGFYEESKPYFHELGWPRNLQKLLRYDNLINIGLGGASNSGQVKRFIEEFDNLFNLSETYDVLVIWMLSFSYRISFYNDFSIKNLSGGSYRSPKDKKIHSNFVDLSDHYYLYVKDVDRDPVLETLFYIKTMQHICNSLKFNFLFTSVCNSEIKLLNKIYNGKHFMNKFYPIMFLAHSDERENYLRENNSRIGCGHLNEKGYKETAERMHSAIEKYWPEYIPPVEYKPEITYTSWRGNGKNMKHLFEENT